MKSQPHIKDILNSSALIVRKYNLGDKIYFFEVFKLCDKIELESAWAFGLTKIQSKEIIKDASHIAFLEGENAVMKSMAFDYDQSKILFYLNSEFDAKKLKLSDENIERRLRKLLADRYIELTSQEISKQLIKSPNTSKHKTTSFFGQFKALFIILGIIGIFSTPRIIKGLTPIETIANKIHEESKYTYRVGAICADGWPSNATGRGACSHHGGVAKWIYDTAYRKTMEECRTEAKKISWRD